MTAVPAPSLTPTGFVAPTEAAILAGLQADIDAAFGGGLNPALETPQGQLASTLAAILGDANDQFLALANGVDPAYATGRMQDAIGRIYFQTRDPATPTTVTATVTGLAGTVIPVGSTAVATDGTIYVASGAVTLPVGGSTTTTFISRTPGPIPCPAGTLNRIYQQIPGWDTVTNPADGSTGTLVESRADFEARRKTSVQANALGSIGAIVGAVNGVSGVTDVFAFDNGAANSTTIGGVSVAAHSIYVAALGGTDAAVAQAIFTKKSPGCGYTGGTTVTVSDPYNPTVSYAVTFQRPTVTPVYFKVQIASGPLVPSDAASQIQNAVTAAFSGGDGGSRARIGGTIYASRFYAPIAALGAWAQIVSIGIGLAANPTGTSVTMQANQAPVTAPGYIPVTIV